MAVVDHSAVVDCSVCTLKSCFFFFWQMYLCVVNYDKGDSDDSLDAAEFGGADLENDAAENGCDAEALWDKTRSF